MLQDQQKTGLRQQNVIPTFGFLRCQLQFIHPELQICPDHATSRRCEDSAVIDQFRI